LIRTSLRRGTFQQALPSKDASPTNELQLQQVSHPQKQTYLHHPLQIVKSNSLLQ